MSFTFSLLWVLSSGLACWHILSHARDPLVMANWIFITALMPGIGPLLYLLFVYRRRYPQLNQNQNHLGPIVRGAIDASADPLVRLMSHLSQYKLSEGNAVQILPDASRALDIICESIRNAKEYIFLEYYIVACDKVAILITDELAAAQKRGVKVCLMYDAHGSRLLLLNEGNFFARLKKAGLRVAGFLPSNTFFRRYSLNHRNHRKLLIIDGVQAFIGGTNLSGDYFGRWHKKQQRDYTFKLEGPVCAELQKIFSRDWKFAARKKLNLQAVPLENKGNAQIQLIPSGPDNKIPLYYTTFLQLLATAETSVRCITPYFIPDQGLSHALMLAARRGVNVQLILPSKIDWMPVLWATYSYLDELLAAGVKIYQYPSVLLHAKMLIVDQSVLLVGSSNLDRRSFYINFELDFLIKEKSTLFEAEALFAKELGLCNPLYLEVFSRRPKLRRIWENFCRLFSPLL